MKLDLSEISIHQMPKNDGNLENMVSMVVHRIYGIEKQKYQNDSNFKDGSSKCWEHWHFVKFQGIVSKK